MMGAEMSVDASDASGDPDPDADRSARDGIVLLRSVATAMVRLHELPNPGTFVLPYPQEAQRALDRTVLTCLLLGARAPLSVPDLIHWCATRSVGNWPLGLPQSVAGADEFLVDRVGRAPTQLCYEWTVDSRDAAARSLDTQVVQRAGRLCREVDHPEAYAAFRRLLVERPVLTAKQLSLLDGDIDDDLGPVLPLVRRLYLDAPAGCLHDGVFTACRRCRILLTPTVGGGWWCERDSCRRSGRPLPGRQYHPAEGGGVLLLARPLRQWITSPGLAEVSLERRLRRLGLPVEMWPGYGAYDLRVELPDGRVWAVEVKDWASPALLGRKAVPLRPAPSYDRSFVVVPHHRTQQRRDYRRVYEHHLPDARSLLPALRTDRELVAEARGTVEDHHRKESR
jgi:hypothetical protein